MKGKLLLLWLVLVTSCVFGQTWVRHLEWEDLVPAWEHNPGANAYNVIPAVDGGYIMHGVVTIHNYVDEYTNVFWKVTESGEVVWRNDQPTFDNTPMTCLVSNGVDKYYGLSSQYHRNILYTYDAQLNPINSIMVDTLLTNGEQIQFWSMIAVDDGLVLCGRNISRPYIMKLDFYENLVWYHWFDNLTLSADIGWLIQTPDSGLIFTDVHDMIRLNSLGDTLWVYEATYPTTGLLEIIACSDGTYYARSESDYGMGNDYILHFDDTGSYLEGYPYTLPGTSSRFGRSFIETTDHQMIILESRYSGYSNDWEEYGMLHKVSPTGNVIWSNVFLQHPYHNDVGIGKSPIFVDGQGYYIFCVSPMTIIRADENGNSVSINDPANDAPEVAIAQVFPNPAMDRISFILDNVSKFKDLSIVVYNLRGQILHQTVVNEKSRIQSWGLPPELRNGVYLFRLKDGRNVIASGKFTIIK